MKWTFYAIALIAFASCGTPKNTVAMKDVPKDAAANSDSCVNCLELRIKNNGPDVISMVTIRNSDGQSFIFDGVKAGATSNYTKVQKLCSCGYEVDVLFFKTEDEQLMLKGSCQNIVKCTQYLQTKATVEITTDKLPAKLEGVKPESIGMKVNIRQD
jgi:hypothetical protein